MRLLWVFIFLVGFWAQVGGQAKAASEPAPRLINFKGQVKLQTEFGGVIAAKRGDLSKWPVFIEADEGSELKIQYLDHMTLSLLGRSAAQVFSDGRLILKYGQLRIENRSSLTPFKLVVTDIAQVSISEGDFVVQYHEAQFRVNVMVLLGQARLAGFNREESMLIDQGEKSSFIAKTEDGKAIFDVMLKGKKIVRGDLVASQKLAVDERTQLLSQVEVKPYVAPRPKEVAKPGQICSKPFASLNQCVWICENNPPGAKTCRFELESVQCVRYRCNANGQWSERFVLPGDRKKTCLREFKPLVGKCDY